MPIQDFYLLKASDKFYVNVREEVTVNLALTRAPLPPKTKLIGKVINSTCCPIANATVVLYDCFNTQVSCTKTNDKGKFSFIGIFPEGKYTVVAKAKHYKTSKNYHICLCSEKTVYLNIKLHKKKQVSR